MLLVLFSFKLNLICNILMLINLVNDLTVMPLQWPKAGQDRKAVIVPNM